MLKSGSLKDLWEHCIKLEALIRSHTDLYIYSLEGQFPEMVMSGQKGDIISPCEFEWFEWVMLFSRRKLTWTTKYLLADGLALQLILALPLLIRFYGQIVGMYAAQL